MKNDSTFGKISELNPTIQGGGHYGSPYQLLSLTAPTGRFSLVQSSYNFGHRGTNYDQDTKILTNYDQDTKNISKSQQCLSYVSCDQMIKNSPCKVGFSCVDFFSSFLNNF